jgi:FlaA1/EpsC-like NDP-sugar epimerase
MFDVNVSDFESVIVQRDRSLFHDDYRSKNFHIKEALAEKNIAIIGGAGSIGRFCVEEILRFDPKRVVIIDLNENQLTEVARNIRSQREFRFKGEIEFLPICLGSDEFERYINEQEPFDYIFNFAAMKHVRSEKNIYSVLRMFDTNVFFVEKLLDLLPYKLKKFFSVSSDKAVRSHNLMGASKHLLEQVHRLYSNKHNYSSARFANVAFSFGSLPLGFIYRLQKKQPIAAPIDIFRYFISHKEAAELCLMSIAFGQNGEVYVPKLSQEKDAIGFVQIVTNLLQKFGFEPEFFDSEKEAFEKFELTYEKKKWPCLFSASITTGEKKIEEFYFEQELTDFERYGNIGVCQSSAPSISWEQWGQFKEFHKFAKKNKSVSKADYVEEVKKIHPYLHHVEKNINLDSRI